jgi:release factor glutamine methyltransferase
MATANEIRWLQPDVAGFEARLTRLESGEPLAYILGSQPFHALELSVTKDVLIPRFDTEILLERALAAKPARLLDLGTGSGALALAYKQVVPSAEVVACDVSWTALDVAKSNAERLGLRVEFHQSDWFAGLPLQHYDMIVSNPPYIAEDDPHLPSLRHEPMLALTSGQDGLDAIRHIVQQAPRWLVGGGQLWLEHGYQQANAVCALLQKRGFVAVQTHLDLEGRERVSGGIWWAGVEAL